MISHLILVTSCNVKAPKKVLEARSNTIQYQSEFDFSFLDEELSDKKIVALGESTHGVGEFYELKSKLIEYLYTKLDFNLIIFESGFADINLAWDEVVQF
ncbi:MAG: hypothetical protein AAGG68_29850, partial [Bacteroidota bacterium]